jgi:hypothetical protein
MPTPLPDNRSSPCHELPTALTEVCIRAQMRRRQLERGRIAASGDVARMHRASQRSSQCPVASVRSAGVCEPAPSMHPRQNDAPLG